MSAIHFLASSAQKAMCSDGKWFGRNPHRDYRARPSVAGESPPADSSAELDGHRQWTLIRLVLNGIRMRTFIYLPDFTAPIDSDESIGEMFTSCVHSELLLRIETGGGDFMWARFKQLRPVSTDSPSSNN
jgi:hypothetical protein